MVQNPFNGIESKHPLFNVCFFPQLESVQWNWKVVALLEPHPVAFSESVQWNWKVPRHPLNYPLDNVVRNPFNGIERRPPPCRRPALSAQWNPFNGIERWSLRKSCQDCLSLSHESVQWNWKSCPSPRSWQRLCTNPWIRSMELKDETLLPYSNPTKLSRIRSMELKGCSHIRWLTLP